MSRDPDGVPCSFVLLLVDRHRYRNGMADGTGRPGHHHRGLISSRVGLVVGVAATSNGERRTCYENSQQSNRQKAPSLSRVAIRCEESSEQSESGQQQHCQVTTVASDWSSGRRGDR